MKVKEAPETPAAYIHFASRNTKQISVQEFETMLGRLFGNLDETAPKAFRDFFNVAHHEDDRLLAPFHKTVKRSLEQLKAGSALSRQDWSEVFAGNLDLLDEDEDLSRFAADRLLGHVIPHLIRHGDTTSDDWQAASCIVAALGHVPAIAETVDPKLTHDLVKWHLRACNDDFTRAASRLTDLRQSPPFIPAVAAIENHAGVHVTSRAASDTDPQGRQLVLVFERAHDHVIARTLDAANARHPVGTVDLQGDNIRYRDRWATMLAQEAKADLPDQAWVAPLARDAAKNLMEP